ncbi:hypothetical protein J437_LFUL017107 [Ladona fulva]|uniref:Zinc transporter ZIP1 n=1 Tax=Ladona fulva TaxID=123851 RepID=A0A8K0P775_LADFU|nr:hypothetical protein J437_LFUL017107 [Ladona fulva]
MASAISESLVAKYISMLFLGLVPLILGILPWLTLNVLGRKNRRFSFDSPRGRLITSLLLCFGGGVLLCTTFFHIQPEVRESVEYLQQIGKLPSKETLRLPEVFLFCGFFFVYLVEEAAHAWLHGRVSAEDDAMHRTVGARRCSGVSQRSDVCSKEACSTIDSTVEMVCPSHDHVHVIGDTVGDLRSSIGGLLAVLALSFHAVFEGLAVGLEAKASSVWVLCGAVAAHKFVIAFCVGIELATARTRPVLLVAYVFTFAFVTPLGIGIGTTLSESSLELANSSVEVVILQGMASGTLIYVVFFEVLQRGVHKEESQNELLGRVSGLVHLFAVLFGFMVMYGLQSIGE